MWDFLLSFKCYGLKDNFKCFRMFINACYRIYFLISKSDVSKSYFREMQCSKPKSFLKYIFERERERERERESKQTNNGIFIVHNLTYVIAKMSPSPRYWYEIGIHDSKYKPNHHRSLRRIQKVHKRNKYFIMLIFK